MQSNAATQETPMTNLVLCLSGGGFRASLFHLGVLKRLHELGLLSRVRVMSAASGGAVTAALFGKYVTAMTFSGTLNSSDHDFAFAYDWDGFEAALRKATARGVLLPYFKSLTIYVCLILLVLLGLSWFVISTGKVSALSVSFIEKLLPILTPLTALSAIILYASMLPLAYRSVLTRRRDEDAMFKSGVTRNFYSSQLPWPLLGLLYPMSPSAMRVATLDSELFDYASFGALDSVPKIYLAAVELNRGTEMIFSREVLAELGATGTVALWDQHADENKFSQKRSVGPPLRVSYETSALPVAVAVAASSAYPPFFRPISICRQNEKLGSFVDGGVLDNSALNAPLEMILHLSEERSRYSKHFTEFGLRLTSPGFTESITDLFIADAGADAMNDPRLWWSSWKSLRRLVDIMFSHQTTNTKNSLRMMTWQDQIEVTSIGLQAGFPLGSELQHDRLSSLVLGALRTHFDKFDEIETAVLVYTGYFWTDKAFRHKAPGAPPRSNFRDIAGSDEVAALSPEELIRHLAYSHLRSSVRRNAARFLANRSPLDLAGWSIICGVAAFIWQGGIYAGLIGAFLGNAALTNMYLNNDYRYRLLAVAGVVLSITGGIVAQLFGGAVHWLL
jgi:Patatin-like phospholipase